MLYRFLLLLALMLGSVQAQAHGAGNHQHQAEDTAAVEPAAAFQPRFNLIDQQGKPRSQDDYRGKVMLVFLGFTSCPDVCPAGLGSMKQVLTALGRKANQIAPIFLSVDPQIDTPARLADYLGALDPRIVGLTGSQAAVDSAVKSFRAYVAKQPLAANAAKDEKGRIDHTAFFYVLDGKGEFVTVLDPTWPTAKLVEQLRPVLR
jgi:protein SCO1/2